MRWFENQAAPISCPDSLKPAQLRHRNDSVYCLRWARDSLAQFGLQISCAVQYAQESHAIRQRIVEDQVFPEPLHSPGTGFGRTQVGARPANLRNSRQQFHAGLEGLNEADGCGGILQMQVAHDVQQIAGNELAFLRPASSAEASRASWVCRS